MIRQSLKGVGIPYLAPELLCLYKSTDPDREGYGQDFELAYAQMDQEQRDWLQQALLAMNPEGHKWCLVNHPKMWYDN